MTPFSEIVTSPTIAPSSAFDDFVLALLRPAWLRARRATNSIEAAGTALAAGLIDGEAALGIVHEAGVLHFVTGATSS